MDNSRILGFQYEPELPTENTETIINYDADNEFSQLMEKRKEKRTMNNISEWCKCLNCFPMPTQNESFCCLEIDYIKYNLLEGEWHIN